MYFFYISFKYFKNILVFFSYFSMLYFLYSLLAIPFPKKKKKNSREQSIHIV